MLKKVSKYHYVVVEIKNCFLIKPLQPREKSYLKLD